MVPFWSLESRQHLLLSVLALICPLLQCCSIPRLICLHPLFPIDSLFLSFPLYPIYLQTFAIEKPLHPTSSVQRLITHPFFLPSFYNSVFFALFNSPDTPILSSSGTVNYTIIICFPFFELMMIIAGLSFHGTISHVILTLFSKSIPIFQSLAAYS